MDEAALSKFLNDQEREIYTFLTGLSSAQARSLQVDDTKDFLTANVAATAAMRAIDESCTMALQFMRIPKGEIHIQVLVYSANKNLLDTLQNQFSSQAAEPAGFVRESDFVGIPAGEYTMYRELLDHCWSELQRPEAIVATNSAESSLPIPSTRAALRLITFSIIGLVGLFVFVIGAMYVLSLLTS